MTIAKMTLKNIAANNGKFSTDYRGFTINVNTIKSGYSCAVSCEGTQVTRIKATGLINLRSKLMDFANNFNLESFKNKIAQGDSKAAQDLAIKAEPAEIKVYKAKYIRGSKIEIENAITVFKLKRDHVGRVIMTNDTPRSVKCYLAKMRQPSKKQPLTYLKALGSEYFARWLCTVDPKLAIDCNVAINK